MDREPLDLEPLRRAFPARPLRVAAPLAMWRFWLLGLATVALFAGGGARMARTALPALLSDHRILDTARPNPKGNVEAGRCRVRWGFLHTCELTLTAPAGPGQPPIRREATYIFADLHLGDREVEVWSDPARPALLTTDLGVETWTDRAVTLAVLLALALGLCVAGLAMPVVGARQRRLAAGMSGQPLQPALADLRINAGTWAVRPFGPGQPSRWSLGGRSRPFLVAGLPLAATAPGSPLFPLDEGLRWLDLTEEERAAIRAARDDVERRLGEALDAADAPERAAAG